MIENKQYTVQFEDVPETEQLIFKLIFSISEKANGRPYKYRIDKSSESEKLDVVVQSASSDSDVNNDSGKIWIMDRGTCPDDCQFVIERPLIATRVLSVLDRFIAHFNDKQLSDVEQKTTVEETVELVDETQTEIDFCISEEEASELAIVDDEALSNPANENYEIAASTVPKPEVADVQKEHHDSTLVAFQRAPSETIEEKADSTISSTSSKKPRAIVVDDSASVRKQIELELNLFDVDVDYAESVEQTQDLLNKNIYDLAFLDVVLPDGDGFQICKSIKQSEKKTSVVMLTGKATAADKIKGTMVGCDAYLVKPVGRMTFQNTVCNYLKLREHNEVMNA